MPSKFSAIIDLNSTFIVDDLFDICMYFTNWTMKRIINCISYSIGKLHSYPTSHCMHANDR